MTVKTLIALGALSSLAIASAASAQAPAPAAAAAVGGPPIAGVCVLSQEGAIANSAAGKSVGERMKQLLAVVQAELTPEGKAVEAERASLSALTPEQLQSPANAKRIEAYQQRAAGLQRREEIRGKELEVTKNKEVALIENEAVPIENQVVTERHCGVVVERNALVWANPQMDITDAVVQRLNAKMSAVPAFDRANLEQQASAAPPAAPAATTTHHKK